jgi:hypothetical protein
VLLIVIVIVGWRCTPIGLEPCRRLFDWCTSRAGNRGHQQARANPSERVFDHSQWFGGGLCMLSVLTLGIIFDDGTSNARAIVCCLSFIHCDFPLKHCTAVNFCYMLIRLHLVSIV